MNTQNSIRNAKHTALAALLSLGIAAGAVADSFQYEAVLARTTDVYEVYCRGGQPAFVTVDGDGDTDLDLYVYDENGNLIDSDDDSTDYCIAGWTPRWSGYFTIKIANLGYVYNEYSLEIDN